MAKEYTGMEVINNFFAHYGRKGMKRGMNIFNPNYKPIGEKAQSAQNAAARQAASAQANAYAQRQRSRISSEEDAKQAAYRSSQQYAGSKRRESLLNAERKRYSEMAKEKNPDREAALNAERKRYAKMAEEKNTGRIVNEYMSLRKEYMKAEQAVNDAGKQFEADKKTYGLDDTSGKMYETATKLHDAMLKRDELKRKFEKLDKEVKGTEHYGDIMKAISAEQDRNGYSVEEHTPTRDLSYELNKSYNSIKNKW